MREKTNYTGWFGNYLNDVSMVMPMLNEEQVKTVPYEARWLNEIMDKFNVVCWEKKIDVNPGTTQIAKPGGQVGCSSF